MRKTRKFQAGTDSLEPRMVLSTVHPAAHVLPVTGSGTLTTVGGGPVAGGVQAKVELAGTFTGLGNSAGHFTVTVPTGSTHFTATGAIKAADGDSVNVNFSGNNQTHRPHATKAVGHFKVTIDGGTGAFANATGNGKITVTQNLTNGSETFSFSGRIHE